VHGDVRVRLLELFEQLVDGVGPDTGLLQVVALEGDLDLLVVGELGNDARRGGLAGTTGRARDEGGAGEHGGKAGCGETTESHEDVDPFGIQVRVFGKRRGIRGSGRR